MNFLDIKLNKRVTIFNAALFCNILYLLLVLLLKGIQGLINTDGVYNTFFGIIEFVAAFLFWIGYNWSLFRKSDVSSYKSKIIYIILNMVPIMIFSLITLIIMYIAPSFVFSVSWNQFSFIIAPTLFWYLPYGYLFVVMRGILPFGLFMILCGVFVAFAQFIGALLGATEYNHEQARLAELRAQQKLRQQQKRQRQEAMKNSPATQAKPRVSPVKRRSTVLESTAQKTYPQRRSKHPFIEQETRPIIYTEAISVISDEMLEEAKEASQTKNSEKEVKETQNPDMKRDGTPNWEIPQKTRYRGSRQNKKD